MSKIHIYLKLLTRLYIDKLINLKKVFDLFDVDLYFLNNLQNISTTLLLSSKQLTKLLRQWKKKL